MINLLNSSTDKLQLVTGAAATLHVVASWVDLNADGSGDPTPGRTGTAISTATTTDIVATPAASKVRNVKEITIYNYHATQSCDVNARYNANATPFDLPKFNLAPGESLEYIEGIGWFEIAAPTLPRIGRVLTADDAGGQAVATVQPWFPTNPALSVPATQTFLMRGLLQITHGATTHTTGLSLTGTATLTSVDYFARCNRSAANGLNAVYSGIAINVATNTVIDVTGIQVATYVEIVGILRTNAAGTLIPNFTFSANPTGTITIKRNSHFWLEPIGDNAIDKIGTWT